MPSQLDEEEERRKRRREKNKVAAARCRNKKKERTEFLQRVSQAVAGVGYWPLFFGSLCAPGLGDTLKCLQKQRGLAGIRPGGLDPSAPPCLLSNAPSLNPDDQGAAQIPGRPETVGGAKVPASN